MTDRLAEEFVIGGLWETAPIYAERDGTKRAGTHLGFDEDGDATFTAGHIIRLSCPGGPEWRLELRLPGPLGCGMHGLEQRLAVRTGVDFTDCTPAWVGVSAAKASRYLVMTDALATLRGWPTGPGAPVYGWESRPDSGHFALTAPNGCDVICGPAMAVDVRIPAGITDPMAALEAAYQETR